LPSSATIPSASSISPRAKSSTASRNKPSRKALAMSRRPTCSMSLCGQRRRRLRAHVSGRGLQGDRPH
jgi:hypothetical protein